MQALSLVGKSFAKQQEHLAELEESIDLIRNECEVVHKLLDPDRRRGEAHDVTLKICHGYMRQIMKQIKKVRTK